MIVRFTTWRHQTIVYRAGKNCSAYGIKLDITKKRLETVIRLSHLLESRKLGSVFADINCRLCARINGKFCYFENEDQLMELIRDAAPKDEDDDTVLADDSKDE